MKVLRVLCGIAILLNALHLGHAIQHFYEMDPNHSAGFWAGVVIAVLVDVLSFIGGCLLLRREGGKVG